MHTTKHNMHKLRTMLHTATIRYLLNRVYNHCHTEINMHFINWVYHHSRTTQQNRPVKKKGN